MKHTTKYFTKFLCAAALFSSGLAMPYNAAMAVEAFDLKVSRLGDVNMSCGQLSQEAVLMRDIILTTQAIKEESDFQNKGITAAGAIGSFLVGSATGGIGIAAAGFLLKEASSEKAEDADTVQDIAEQRRSLMVGIYNAKGCDGPIDHAMLDFVPDIQSRKDASTERDAYYASSIEPATGQKNQPEQDYNP